MDKFLVKGLEFYIFCYMLKVNSYFGDANGNHFVKKPNL